MQNFILRFDMPIEEEQQVSERPSSHSFTSHPARQCSLVGLQEKEIELWTTCGDRLSPGCSGWRKMSAFGAKVPTVRSIIARERNLLSGM